MIPGPRGLEVHSHCLFADDVMIFCRGDKGSITYLINLFYMYANSSRQMVNPLKSYIFAGSISEARLHHIF